MERALIIGASGGIGQALGVALRDRGVAVTALSRRDDGLEIAHEASVASHLGALVPGFDLIIVASGALAVDGAAPEKALRQVTAQAMLDQFAVNTVGPAMALKYGLPLLRRDGRAVMAVLSARVGSIGDNRLGGWLSYRSAKAAVNQVVHTAAIELARSHKQAICVALHPGTVATPLTRAYLGRHPAVAPDAAAGHLLAVIDALGPAQSGGFFD
ncbi:MAG: SDR family NAD(P)-dependent oxidoreductase, partial [Marinibacterium sp.]|nr:SDR family NAD(P)-dependent oxidoreductase [Marinibacterium sp.]